MNDMWGAQYVDRQVDRAWMELRLALADRFAAGLAEGSMDALDISTATGETLTATIEDGHVVIVAGDDVYTSDNIDAAAYSVFQVLHHAWQVVHPVFLATDLIEVPAVEDNPVGTVVPTIGKAESREQLQEWVEAVYTERLGHKVKVMPNGGIGFSNASGSRAVIRVRNAGRIELMSVLAREVSLKKAHAVMDELSRKWFGLKFFLVQDVLFVSQTLNAEPFVPEQLINAMRTFMDNVGKLSWVAEKVLSKRAKADRARVEAAEAAKEAAEEAQAEAERLAEQRTRQRNWAKQNLDRVRAERNAAREELAELKAMLAQALRTDVSTQRTFSARPERGDVA